jgi:hypothetical protein
MKKKTYKSYVVVGTGVNEGGYLKIPLGSTEPSWVAYYGNATMFVDTDQADHLAEVYQGVVKTRTITEI